MGGSVYVDDHASGPLLFESQNFASLKWYEASMSGPGDQPPGVPFRVYGRTDGGRLRFIGVAVVFGSAGGEVRFRWAASRTVRTMPEREWDAWVKELVDFKVRLFPKLDSP